ncbi:MAG: hypothetical protein OXC97_00275 [Candidatus Dadabacteria bacterium]|nr:hypothetical protein [Candidatus Dadabacteria bacterium]
MKHIKRFFLLIICCFLAIFFIQNFEVAEKVFEIEFGFFSYKYTSGVYNAGIIAVSFLLGGFVFFLLSFSRSHSSKSELKQSRKTIKSLEEKVGKLEVELLQNRPAGYQEQSSSSDLFRAPK